MKDRYYSEFISEKFHEKISALRIAKEIQTFECFAFIFVNAYECKCKFVKENDLETTKIEDEALTNINNIIFCVRCISSCKHNTDCSCIRIAGAVPRCLVVNGNLLESAATRTGTTA